MTCTKYLILALLCVFSWAGVNAEEIESVVAPRKKVAVVLSGGGARGMAHIGALKVIEQAGIPIDYVVGTSMGSIIGGLYSIGYTPNQLDSMVRKQDWFFLFSDKARRHETSFTAKEQSSRYLLTIPFGEDKKKNFQAGFIQGQNLENLFYSLTFGYHDSISFNSLPIPFACVAVDAVNGKEKVFHSGVLPVAMRASMAIPAVFSPVRMDSMVLVDGGVANNYPVDVAREMGADIVIGVDVQQEMKKPEDLRNAPDILWQIIDFYGRDKYKKNVLDTDTYIKVNVKGFSSASFTLPAIDSLITRGREAASLHKEDLNHLKAKIGIDSAFVVERDSYKEWKEQDSFYVDSILFLCSGHVEKEILMKRCRLKEHSEMTMMGLQYALSCLYGESDYEGISYRLVSTPKGYNLEFELKNKVENLIRAGFRFDSEEVASALLNVSLKLKSTTPSWISATGRLGKRSSIRGDYTLRVLPSCDLNVAYMFQYNDVNVYRNGARSYNVTYAYNFAELAFLKTLGNRLKGGLGMHVESFDYKGVLYNGKDINTPISSDIFLSYFASLSYDSFNKRYFPSRGAICKIDYSLYTDNMGTYKGGAPFSALSLVWRAASAVNDRFAILPAMYGRVLIGDDVAYSYYNMIGGDVVGHYFPQQLPFAGINNVELCKRSIVIAAATFRYRVGQNHYFSLVTNLGVSHDRFQQILNSKTETLVGGSIGYGFDSIAGPLEFSFNVSNRTDKLGYYLNIGYVF